MKIKIIQDFRDRNANLKLVKAGTTYETDPERADMLISRGFAEKLPEEKKTKEVKTEAE